MNRESKQMPAAPTLSGVTPTYASLLPYDIPLLEPVPSDETRKHERERCSTIRSQFVPTFRRAMQEAPD